MTQQSNKPRQSVKNSQLDAVQLYSIDNKGLKDFHENWIVEKMYDNRKLGSFSLPYEEGTFYKGYITDYYMQKAKLGDKTVFYINFFITVNIPEYGVGELFYKVNANFTPNSDFCKLLFNLGINPTNTFEFQLDDLINLPVWARLTKNDDFIEVAEMEKRQI